MHPKRQSKAYLRKYWQSVPPHTAVQTLGYRASHCCSYSHSYSSSRGIQSISAHFVCSENITHSLKWDFCIVRPCAPLGRTWSMLLASTCSLRESVAPYTYCTLPSTSFRLATYRALALSKSFLKHWLFIQSRARPSFEMSRLIGTIGSFH